MRVIKAKYGGTCRACNQHINVGDSIAYGGAGAVYHEACAPKETETVPRKPPATPRRAQPGTNRRIGQCSICQSDVPIGEGGMWRGLDGRWRITCKACLACADEYGALPLEMQRLRAELLRQLAECSDSEKAFELVQAAKELV